MNNLVRGNGVDRIPVKSKFYTYGLAYRNEIEDIWIPTSETLHRDERIHIIAYNQSEQDRIEVLLQGVQIDMAQIDFVIVKSDDVWIRDTGSMFVLLTQIARLYQLR